MLTACRPGHDGVGAAACAQGEVNWNDADPDWDMVQAPFAACVTYMQDLAPLSFGDRVRAPAKDAP